MENNKAIAILNLTGELTQELGAYFSKHEIKVIDPLVSDEKADWTHILTKDIHDFSLLRKTYKTLEKDIKLVSLTKVDDIQNFIMSNGKLILDEIWMQGPLGEFILDKFFQEYAGINLGDNYPTFQERGAFNITNPFNTGEYLDKLVHQAFTDEVAALSVKTFFDHLLMFLTGLKNKEKIGLPIEVTYGVFDAIFAVQMHFFTQNLMLEDVSSCLSSSITKKAEEYLLNVSVQSADFFDFTFLSQVNKVVVTGLWTKDEKIRIENRGLMFANLSSAATLSSYPTEGISSSLISEKEIEDMSSKVLLPAPKQVDDSVKVSGEKLSESLAQKISSTFDLEKVKQIIQGDIDEDTLSQVVAGSTETEEGKVILGSEEEMKDILNLVKGSIEEENSILKISGSKLDPDNFAMRVSSGLMNKAKGDDLMKIKALGQKLPESIKTGLFDFASRLNKPVEDLSVSDMETFQNFEIPKMIKSHTTIVSAQPKALLKDLKRKLEAGLMAEFMEDSIEKVIASVKTPEDESRVMALVKSTLKNSLDSNFHLSERNSISQVEQDILVKSLSSSLSENEDKIRQIIGERIEQDSAVNPLFKKEETEAERELKLQVSAVNQENANLKAKLKTAMAEVKVLKETKANMASIQEQAAEAAAKEVPSQIVDNDEELRRHYLDKLAQQEVLNEQDQERLRALLERENKLILDAKQEEMKARKVQIESVKKESMFAQELEKSNRQIKAKDLMLAKIKETVQKITDKKDYEINDLKQKLDQVSRALSSGPSPAQATQLRDLEKQNQNLNKMLEVYKTKVSSLATNIQAKQDDGKSKEEIRRLQMLNNQFKNQFEMAKKELGKYRERITQETTQVKNLRQEKVKLEQLLKKAAVEAAPKAQASHDDGGLEKSFKKAQADNQALENQLKEATTRLKDAETKLAEALKNQRGQSTVDNTVNAKLNQLEGNVKKLTQDLIESRNLLGEMKKDTNKLRQEKTALQNQLDRMKKEAQKAAAKKPGKAA
jgi:hypothetical protein